MASESDTDQAGQSVGVAQGIRHATRNYKLSAVSQGPNRVNIIQTNAGRVRADGSTAGQWIFRVDEAHRGAQHAHVNINPQVSGTRDPHFRIPEGTPGVAQKGAKILKKANKVMLPVAIALDSYQTYKSASVDYEYGTTRNTVETVSSIAGGWGGGFAGAEIGAAIGTLSFPGVGTIVGGIFGGIAGGFAGSYGAGAAAEFVGDECDYDVEERTCRNCGRRYKCRRYRGEDTQLCRRCRTYD